MEEGIEALGGGGGGSFLFWELVFCGHRTQSRERDRGRRMPMELK
jgi:hypothetical protein